MTELSELLLRDSQLDTTRFVINNPACAVFSDMGFGKTVALLTAIRRLLNNKEVNRVLVVSTLLVSRETWPTEIQAWTHTAGIEYRLLLGTAQERLAAAKSGGSVHIINQENFVWLAEKAGKTWPYDMVVFDDAKGFKSHNRKNHSKTAICQHADDCPVFEPADGSRKACAVLCKRFKPYPARYSRFGALCALRSQIKRLVHLTGTPSSKDLLDLWPMIFSLDGGARLGRTITQYRNTYFAQNHNGFGYRLLPGSAEIIHSKVKDICIAIPSEAKLPPVHHVEIPVKMPDKAEMLYESFKRDMLLKIENKEVEAPNAGVLAGKLLQICGGAVYHNEEKEWLQLHDSKLKALKEIVKKHKGEPILVGYNYNFERFLLKKWFPEGVDIRNRKNAVDAWNAGKIPLMWVHPDSAGHGLNLQKGPGRVLVWYGLQWSLSLNKQLNKRLHRPGQQQEVYIYYLIVKGKADSLVMKGVAEKDWTQQQLLDALIRR